MPLLPSRRNWILLPLSLSAVAIAGIVVTTEALHPDPQAIAAVTAATPSPEWLPAVERSRQLIRATLAAQNVPGLSIAVGRPGGIVWSEGFGWSELRNRVPITPETRFRLGTASTVLTSAAAGMLLEQGRLKLQEEIQTYVPAFPRKQTPVTLQQLMANHTVAATEDAGDAPLAHHRCAQPLEALPHFAAGSQYKDPQYGWILVSAAIEAASKQPLPIFLREQILQRAGMANTGAESAAEENPEHIGEPGEDAPFLTLIRHNILEPLGFARQQPPSPTTPATIYHPGVVSHRLHEAPPRNLSCYSGSMAFYSTPSDLVRLGLALQSGTLLSPATRKATTATVYHGQLSGKTIVSLLLFPESGLVVAVSANNPSADTPALARQIAAAFASPR